MATWMFEPGHTEAEFRARHMMVTWVRGLFKDIHGQLELDWNRSLDATFEGEIDATGIWTGEPQRDEHLRSADSSTSRTTRRSASAAASASARPRPHSRARST
jgi:polyisoprenoid-binding protein YceI